MIDTKKDSVEDIKKAISFLQSIGTSDKPESGMVESPTMPKVVLPQQQKRKLIFSEKDEAEEHTEDIPEVIPY